MKDDDIIADFFQGQTASNIMRLSLEVRCLQYLTCFIVRKIAEGQADPEVIKRAMLDAWHDTELNTAVQQVKDAQAALRSQGIIPMDADKMMQPVLNQLKQVYASMCDQLYIPVNNPKAAETA